MAIFPKISEHPEWIPAHSRAWYNQLGERQGVYRYTWRWIPDGPQAEDALTEALERVVRGRVLDVGCGHGEYAKRWSDRAEEVVGLDVTSDFLETANRDKAPNMRFVLGDTKEGLPFPAGYFDLAYTKKGPTSWYAEGNRVVKPGGYVIGLHPGAEPVRTGSGDLRFYFPGLFGPASEAKPVGGILKERLDRSGLHEVRIQVVHERGFLPRPEDVLHMACFGQTEEVFHYVMERCYRLIEDRFAAYAVPEGLPVVAAYYLVTAIANGGGGAA